MADEVEKKPGFVVHKKVQGTAPSAAQTPSAPEKKRIVVVKKKPQQNQPSQNADSAKKGGVQVVVKKAEQTAQTQTDKHASAPNGSEQATQKTGGQNSRPRTFELNQARPNVKAGNLSDHGRQNNNRGGYNRNGGQGGYNNYNRGGQNGGQGGFNRNGGQGGFNGAQARQSYQNRERDNREGGQGFNRGGQGGFNRGQGGQGFNRQGGFNRGGQPGQGGFRPRPMGGGMGAAAPIPVDQQRTQGKKAAYKGKKQVYNRKDEEQYDDNLFEQKKKVETPASVVPREIEIMETVSVSDSGKVVIKKFPDGRMEKTAYFKNKIRCFQ